QRSILRGGQHPSSIQHTDCAWYRWNWAELSSLQTFHRKKGNLETGSADSIQLSRDLFVRLSGSQRIVWIEQMHHGLSLPCKIVLKCLSLGMNRCCMAPIYKAELVAFGQSRETSADRSRLIGFRQT